MKTVFSLVVMFLLFVVSGRCFADWDVVFVSTEDAKKLGMEVRASADSPNQPNQVRVELEFTTEGTFEEFSPKGKFGDRSGVNLRVGERDQPTLTLPLKEDRSKPGRVVVSFHADRAQMDKLTLRVIVPEELGGSIYELRVNDFVEPAPARPVGKDGNEREVSKRLQGRLLGKWLQQSRTVDGKQLKDPDGCFLMVTNDGMMKSYTPVGSSEGQGPSLVQNVQYRLNEAENPVTIDEAGRRDWSDVLQGIILLEDDTLTLCYAAKNKPRPTMFSTGAEAGMGHLMIVYKRVVKDRN